jgi:hypothetical protein
MNRGPTCRTPKRRAGEIRGVASGKTRRFVRDASSLGQYRDGLAVKIINHLRERNDEGLQVDRYVGDRDIIERR